MEDRWNDPATKREENSVTFFERGVVEVEGKQYQRYAIKTHFVERGECYKDIVTRYVAPILQDGDMLSSAEKIISMCQNEVVERSDIKVGFWANILWRFASYSPAGQGVRDPHNMQLAINLAGLPRILWAAFCSGIGKIFRRKGVFYRIAGHGIDGIDGLYHKSPFEPYHNLAILNPREPDKVAAELEEILGIPAMVVDANDFTVEIFGKSPSMTLADATLCAIMKDNPSQQGGGLTPLVLIRPQIAAET